jgi:hypothetical protein
MEILLSDAMVDAILEPSRGMNPYRSILIAR